MESAIDQDQAQQAESDSYLDELQVYIDGLRTELAELQARHALADRAERINLDAAIKACSADISSSRRDFEGHIKHLKEQSEAAAKQVALESCVEEFNSLATEFNNLSAKQSVLLARMWRLDQSALRLSGQTRRLSWIHLQQNGQPLNPQVCKFELKSSGPAQITYQKIPLKGSND
jgi:hypothetical protein